MRVGSPLLIPSMFHERTVKGGWGWGAGVEEEGGETAEEEERGGVEEGESFGRSSNTYGRPFRRCSRLSEKRIVIWQTI